MLRITVGRKGTRVERYAGVQSFTAGQRAAGLPLTTFGQATNKNAERRAEERRGKTFGVPAIMRLARKPGRSLQAAVLARTGLDCSALGCVGLLRPFDRRGEESDNS